MLKVRAFNMNGDRPVADRREDIILLMLYR